MLPVRGGGCNRLEMLLLLLPSCFLLIFCPPLGVQLVKHSDEFHELGLACFTDDFFDELTESSLLACWFGLCQLSLQGCHLLLCVKKLLSESKDGGVISRIRSLPLLLAAGCTCSNEISTFRIAFINIGSDNVPKIFCRQPFRLVQVASCTFDDFFHTSDWRFSVPDRWPQELELLNHPLLSFGENSGARTGFLMVDLGVCIPEISVPSL